jgi:hypothetical protein
VIRTAAHRPTAVVSGLVAASALLLATFAAGCTEKLVAPPPPEPLLGVPDSIQEIFTANCAYSNCHGGATPQQGMGLGDARTSWLAIVGVASAEKPEFMRVAPGDSANSYVVMKLRADPRRAGQPMPQGAYPLDPELVMKVASWAQNGAPGQERPTMSRQAPIFSTSTNVE